MKKVFAITVSLFFFLSLPKDNLLAQSPQSWTSAEMYQALRKLNVLGSVLYLAAHPDDENTRLIAYLSKDKLYRTGYLSMTRGDGGQNLIGLKILGISIVHLGVLKADILVLVENRLKGKPRLATRRDEMRHIYPGYHGALVGWRS